MVFNKYTSVIRHKIKNREFKDLLIKPHLLLFFIFFLIRSLFLRIFPQTTVFYFIRIKISDLVFQKKENTQSDSFKIIKNLTDELIRFVKARSEENEGLIFQYYQSELEKRFERGDIACALLKGNKITSILFLSFHKVYVEDIDYTFLPAENEAVVKDIYTLKVYRKKGLYYLLIENVANYLANAGYETITMWIMRHNQATIHAQKNIGFKTVFQKVKYCTWLGFKKTIVNANQQALSDL